MPPYESISPAALPSDAIRTGDQLRDRLSRQFDSSTASAFDPPPIPDHTLHYAIGEGACGEVWLAESTLGTLRAVKIVYRARFKDDRPYEREFDGILKYEPISRSHEGLVQVLHVGRKDDSGCFYYVMELADDSAGAAAGTQPSYQPRTLRTELARRQRLPATEAAQLTLRLAQALGHLHDHGLVHRDIKPSNIIFVSGQPKLADIGLVTDVGSAQSFVGTEGFIPPEGPGTPRADLYAMGKLLYELATGRDRMDFPQLPLGVEHLPDGEALLELNEIVTRACAPNPAQRYANASEFQADLNLFLAGRSLRRARHIERYVARSKQLVAAPCLVLAITMAALWFSKREEQRAEAEAQAANARARTAATLRHRAEVAERHSQQQLYAALLEQARATVRSGEQGQRVQALDAIRRAAAISNTVELRREVLAALALPDMHLERELPAGPDITLRLLDSSFERIALCRSRGPVEIRRVWDDRLLATLPASTNLRAYAASWSVDGRFLVVKRDYDAAGYGSDLEVWNVAEARQVFTVHDARWNARTISPVQPHLLTGAADGYLVLWDLETGRELGRRQFDATPECLVYSPDGQRVGASYRREDGWGVSVHNATDGSELTSHVFTNRVASIEWSPDGHWIAVVTFGGEVNLLHSGNGTVRTLGSHKAEAVTAVFSPGGEFLLTGGWERELICWDLRTFQRAMAISRDSYVAQFRADGQACALITLNSTQLHTFESPAAHQRLAEDFGPRLRHAAFSPDGRWLAASADKRVGVWKTSHGSLFNIVESGLETQLFWTMDSRELYGSCRNENGYRWRLAGSQGESLGLQSLPPTLPRDFISLQVISNQVVWTGNRGTRIAPSDGGSPDDGWVETIQGMTGSSGDGRWMAICRGYGSVLHIYDFPSLSLAAKLTNLTSIAGFSFSPSGHEVAVASRGQIEFWSTATWERTRCATNFIGIPDVGLLYAPDGRTLWLAKDFRTAGLYDAHTLKPIFFLPTGMIPVAISPDGEHLAVSVDAQRLQVWDLVEVRRQLRELGLDWIDPL